jgi:glycerate kinase
MKAVIAFNSFKGSLTSIEAGEAAKEGILAVYPDAEISLAALADGGEGTLEALVSALGGHIQRMEAEGYDGEKRIVKYAVSSAHNKAIIEVAKICGLTQVKAEGNNPLLATTYGVGEVIRNAIQRGCRHFIIGLGGSATNDGGVGMLQALGFSFTSKDGKEVSKGAEGLKDISRISAEKAIPELKECSFILASDVNNPLYGKTGSTFVYGAQKGLGEEDIKRIDKYMKKYAELTKEKINPAADPSHHGAGAAGGLGFAFEAYLGAKYSSGAELVIKANRIEDKIKACDYVLTGEGKLDEQTLSGKGPYKIVALGQKYHKKIMVFAGKIDLSNKALKDEGFVYAVEIKNPTATIAESMEKEVAKSNLKETVRKSFEAIKNTQL